MKSTLIRILEYKIKLIELENKFYNLGIDLPQLTEELNEEIFFEFINYLFDDDEKASDLVYWWLYEDVDKIITTFEEKEIDVTKVEDFVNHMMEEYTV